MLPEKKPLYIASTPCLIHNIQVFSIATSVNYIVLSQTEEKLLDRPDQGRRKAPRVAGSLRVKFESVKELYEEFTQNISKGGLFIKTTESFSSGDLLDIYLEISGSFKAIKLQGKVVHFVSSEAAKKSGSAQGIGVQFIDLSKGQIDHLRKVIEDIINKKQGSHQDDRRQSPRVKARLKVKFASEGALKERYTLDISRGGIFIPTPKPLDVGDIIQVVLIHPVTQEEMTLIGKVTRKVEKKTKSIPVGMGIAFTDVKGRHEDIERFVFSAGVANVAAEEGEVEGRIQDTGIENVIHMISQVVEQGRLTLKNEESNEQAIILFKNNNLADITLKPVGLKGEKALFRILFWEKGHFWFKKDKVEGKPKYPLEPTLALSLQQRDKFKKDRDVYPKDDDVIMLKFRKVKELRGRLTVGQKEIIDLITGPMSVIKILNKAEKFSDMDVLENLKFMLEMDCMVVKGDS